LAVAKRELDDHGVQPQTFRVRRVCSRHVSKEDYGGKENIQANVLGLVSKDYGKGSGDLHNLLHQSSLL